MNSIHKSLFVKNHVKKNIQELHYIEKEYSNCTHLVKINSFPARKKLG